MGSGPREEKAKARWAASSSAPVAKKQKKTIKEKVKDAVGLSNSAPAGIAMEEIVITESE